MKKIVSSIVAALVLTLGAANVSAAESTTPKSVIHVVTVSWKEGTTPAQIQEALDGVKKLPQSYKGITRVWVKSIKVQGGKANAFVMEFKDEEALQKYADSAAQKEWYKTYLPIRQESTTFDITN